MIHQLCLDANIFLSFLSPDETNKTIDQLFRKITMEESVIWGPALVNFEVAGVINRKVKMKLIKSEHQTEAIQLFCRLPLVLLFNEELMTKTMELQKNGIKSVYDASYLATAIIKSVPLITCDEELLQKGKKLYPAVFTPEQWG